MKPRVLIVNKFYYPRGGDCVCTINLERMLRANGHETAIYAMDYPQNIACCDSGYFASMVDFSSGIAGKIKAVARALGYGDIRTSFSRMLHDFKPDIVHLQNIHSYLSPILAEIAKSHGSKVAWTLHDYKLICPSYSCFRDGLPCELCFEDKSQVVNKRCMKGSLAASIIGYVEAKKWNSRRLQQATDIFICPSNFMKAKMLQGGFLAEKLDVLCNFVDPIKFNMFLSAQTVERKDYYCYIGRLSQEKGIETLLEAASRLPYTLYVVGTGPLENDLRNRYESHSNISFLGHKSAEDVGQLLSEARFSILPSEWYENNPLGVIESLCAGTPVVGADIGGIPELISDYSGIIFRSKDINSLTDAIEKAWTRKWDNAEIRDKSLTQFAPSTHYDRLIDIYNRLLSH